MLSLIPPEEIKQKREELLQAFENLGIPQDVYRRTISKRRFKNDFDFMNELANELRPWDQTEITEASLEDLKEFRNFFFFRQGTLLKQRTELLTFLKEHAEFRANTLLEIFQSMSQKFMNINEWRRTNNLPLYKYLNQDPDYGGPTKIMEAFPIPPVLPMRQENLMRPSQELPDEPLHNLPP